MRTECMVDDHCRNRRSHDHIHSISFSFFLVVESVVSILTSLTVYFSTSSTDLELISFILLMLNNYVTFIYYCRSGYIIYYWRLFGASDSVLLLTLCAL